MTVTISSAVGLGSPNKSADVVAVKTRLVALGFVWLKPDDQMGPVSINAIRLFQAMKNGVNNVDIQVNDGRIDPNGDTLKWLNASNAPEWRLMSDKGPGFENFERQDAGDHHDFGSSWLDDTIVATGAAYGASHLDSHPNAALLTVNDASLPQGGNTPAHMGHEAGLVCDVRLPRTDGKAGGITTNSKSYDRAAMRAQIEAFLRQRLALRVFLIDEVLNQAGLCRPVAGHDNHAHFEIKPPARIDA